MQETHVQSLGQEDPLEKETETHSSVSAWVVPWTEEPGVGYGPWGHKESDMTQGLNNKNSAIVQKIKAKFLCAWHTELLSIWAQPSLPILAPISPFLDI